MKSQIRIMDSSVAGTAVFAASSSQLFFPYARYMSDSGNLLYAGLG